jgi:hypothetical protein
MFAYLLKYSSQLLNSFIISTGVGDIDLVLNTKPVVGCSRDFIPQPLALAA